MAKNSNDNKQSAPEIISATDPKGKNAKNAKKKKRKKHPVAFGIFLFIFSLFVAGMLTFIIVSGNMLSYIHSFVEGNVAIDLDTYKNSQNQTSIMYAYDSDNNVVELTRLHGEENRIWVDYDEMPDNLMWAFVCLEDKRFYDHSGVDWIRTIGVLVKPQYKGQGGSTITQQLIKNLTDQNEATYNRKFNEILRALNMERYYSKKDILEAYLNTVYLGAGCYGVKTAAETYFGKSVSELNTAECAILASITKSPYSLNPYVDLEGTIERQQLCLSYMHDQGKLTDKQYNKALKTKIVLANESADSSESVEEKQESAEILNWYEEYVIDNVISDLQDKYDYDYNEAWRQVYYGGLSIYSAVDMDIQDWLESVYENRSGFPYSSYDSRGELPQSSMTIMDYEGRIVALVGGTGEKTTNRSYNRATDNRAKRQPGSSIKPLAVYAPAIDMGLITANSSILEKAITYNGETWPRNFNGDYGSGSYVTVENALVRSLNTVPVRILSEMLGVNNSLDYCNNKFHLNLSEKDKDLSPLAVGGTSTGVTTLEMASAFATFGNGGRYYNAYSYYQVKDRNGNVILDNTDNQPEQAITPSTSSTMLSMLTKAVTQSNGTGYGSKISGFQTFAKTGTTSDNCDKWYCGGTPYYVASVWYGYDYRADLRTGSSNPAKTIFHYVFADIHKNLESRTFSEVVDEINAKDENYVAEDTTAPTTEVETTTEATTTKETTTSTTQVKTTKESTTEKTTQKQTSEATTRATTAPTTAQTTVQTTAPTTAPTTAQPTTAAPDTTAPTVAPSIDDNAAA